MGLMHSVWKQRERELSERKGVFFNLVWEWSSKEVEKVENPGVHGVI